MFKMSTFCLNTDLNRCIIDLRTRSQTPGILRMSSEHATIRFEGIPNQAPETNKPMILNGPTSRNREGWLLKRLRAELLQTICCAPNRSWPSVIVQQDNTRQHFQSQKGADGRHTLLSIPDGRLLRHRMQTLIPRRLKWAGHVARMGESKIAYRVLVGRPEGKRPLGRPRRRWEDNIKMDLREMGYDYRDWIGLAQDRDRWRAYNNKSSSHSLRNHLLLLVVTEFVERYDTTTACLQYVNEAHSNVQETPRTRLNPRIQYNYSPPSGESTDWNCPRTQAALVDPLYYSGWNVKSTLLNSTLGPLGSFKMRKREGVRKAMGSYRICLPKKNYKHEDAEKDWLGDWLRRNCLLKDALEGMVNGRRV
ncbi:hypothetical protein ANN_09221 [Periplaneta americana]|uniref:Uncharacterized protein n=1 Tax=Periplaneta americana TaxID=6978 RepID=A0ABQ8TKS4_PERAM|nr:hypothetical protein ANN_09221 [Periplaneta americana]